MVPCRLFAGRLALGRVLPLSVPRSNNEIELARVFLVARQRFANHLGIDRTSGLPNGGRDCGLVHTLARVKRDLLFEHFIDADRGRLIVFRRRRLCFGGRRRGLNLRRPSPALGRRPSHRPC